MRPSLPPGPNRGRLTQSVLFHRDPLGALRRARARHGDVFTLRLAGVGTLAVVAAPTAAEEVVSLDQAIGHAGAARRDLLPQISPRSVLGADEGLHQTCRARLAPVFAPNAIARRRPAIERLAEEHVARWPRGRPLQLVNRVRDLTSDVFARLIVGVRDEHRARALAAATRRMLWTPGNPPLAPPGDGDGLLGLAGAALWERRQAPVARLLHSEIDARRGAPVGTEAETLDVAGALLAAEPEAPTAALADELLPLLMAGQEPPSAALAWLLDRLAREPAQAERLAASPAPDARHDPFVRETLRLRPAVHSVMRKLARPAAIAGHALPGGVVATAPMILLHRDPGAFPDPTRFDPGRWHDGRADERAYLPFGGGARRCLGEALAHAEIEAILPVVARRLRLTPVWPAPERMLVRGTVTTPHRGGLVVAHDR